MAIEWLLIGGPADGKKLTIKHGPTVRWAGTPGDHEYRGETYMYRGQAYRIGCVDPNDLVPSKVERMIDETGLRPIPA